MKNPMISFFGSPVTNVLMATVMCMSAAVALEDPPAVKQPAKASSASGKEHSEVYDTVTALQDASAVTELRLKLAEQQRDLAKAQRDVREAGGDTGSFDDSPSPGESPMVMRIEGLHGALSAVILMPSGGLLEARSGDNVGASGKIVAITASGVKVEQKGVIRSLSFAAPRSTMEQVSERGLGQAQSGAQFPGGRGMTSPPVPLSPPTRAQQQ
jgi:type IV pilus biogenesis protein PilP